MKINTKLAMAFVLMCLLSLTLAAVLSYFIAKAALTRQMFNQLESIAEIQKSRIESIIDQNLERLALISSRTQLRLSLRDFIRDSSRERQEKINRILLDARSAVSSLEEIYVATPDGEIVGSTDPSRIGMNYSDKRCFVMGKSGNNVGDLFLNENLDLRERLSGPLRVEDKLVGVVIVETDAGNFVSLVRDYCGLGETGETLLARRDNNGNALFLTPLRFDQYAALRRSVSKDDPSQAAMQALLRESRLFTEAFDYRGEPVLAATRYIEKVGWGLVVKLDKVEAFARIRQMQGLLILILAPCSIIAVIISLRVARSITKPIVKLTRVATAISEGDIGQRATVSSRDETGVLAKAFNQMTQDLIGYSSALENKVEELKAEMARRAQAEEALQESETSLIEAQRIAHLGNWDWNIVSNELRWSDETYRIFGLSPQGFGATYEAFLESVHPDDRELVKESVSRTLRNSETYSIDHRIVLPDGSDRIVHEKAEILRDEADKAVRMIGTVQDITERKRTEEKIREYQDELRALSSELSLAEERERKRLAAALHDSVGQTLAISKLRLGELGQLLMTGESKKLLHELRDIFEKGIRQLRTLTFELSPPILYELGLEAALEWLGEQFEQQHGVKFHFESDDAPLKDMNQTARVLLFQSVRELLLNVGKHAKAQHVNVSISSNEGDVIVVVEDDGVGFDDTSVREHSYDKNSFGLFSIRERMWHIAGTMQIESKSGSGTTVTLSAPMKFQATARQENQNVNEDSTG